MEPATGFASMHATIKQLFPFKEDPGHLHNKQVESHMNRVTCRQDMYFRSIFGMVHVYNRLPQYVVDSMSITEFQNSNRN